MASAGHRFDGGVEVWSRNKAVRVLKGVFLFNTQDLWWWANTVQNLRKILKFALRTPCTLTPALVARGRCSATYFG